ncbi:MAG: hypothetical protein HUU15_08465 [Candidatus Brocadiae bacterium]|nr:hypothetical protein [Candidatus Brocadiia bacterium]
MKLLSAVLVLALSAVATAQSSLEIVFLDEVKPLTPGKDIRFEVHAATTGGKSKMKIEQLEFTQTPDGWAAITIGEEPTIGVITVRKLISGGGIFDETEYSLKALIKGEGTGRIKSKSRFRLETGLCLIPLNLSYSWDGTTWKEFDAATIAQLDPKKNFTVSDPSAMDIVRLDGVFYARWLKESASAVEVLVTFPNSEKASLSLEFHCRKTSAETTPPPVDPGPVPAGDAAAEIDRNLKEIEDTLELMTTYEGKSFMLADQKRKWIVDGLKRTKRMIGDYRGDGKSDLAARHNGLVDRSYESRIRYREAGSAGNIPAKELQVLGDNERDVLLSR